MSVLLNTENVNAIRKLLQTLRNKKKKIIQHHSENLSDPA
jgi:hypothetical protein